MITVNTPISALAVSAIAPNCYFLPNNPQLQILKTQINKNKNMQ